jgi:hypothetical protein
MRRILTGGVSAFAVLSFALAGCSGTDTAAPEKAEPTARQIDAATLLPQSLRKLQDESFRFTSTITMDGVEIKGSGAFDMAKKVGLVKMDMGATAGEAMALEMRVLGDDMYMSGFLGNEGWIRLDLTKFPAGNVFGEAANPIGNADYLLAVSDDVKEVGKGRFEGTLDLKKYLDEHADQSEAKKLEGAIGKLGPEALKVPFEATVDGENRLTAMKLTMTLDAGNQKATMVQESKYFDFGTKVDVAAPPAGEVTDAPTDLYKN